MSLTAQPQARRPRDRKAQLASAAAELFRRHGYHAVGVNDIAAAAGITGPAVYRHFQSKQGVLAHVLLRGVDELAEAVGPLIEAAEEDPGARLPELLRAGAAASIEHRDLTALWRWQGRHLHAEDQREIVRRTGALLGSWVGALRRLRPELGENDAALLCFAVLSVYGSVGDHHAAPPAREFEDLLARVALAVLRSRVVPSSGPAEAEPAWSPVLPPPTRREELLTAATRLFRDRGFPAVSMEDIGAAAGIAGPSIYRHFAGKSDILLAASRRMADRLADGLATSLRDAGSPEDALARLARSYVDNVLRSDDLIAVYTTELANLPERDAKELRRLQRDYVAQWVRLLRETAPELSDDAARVIVHAALTVVNDLPRTRAVSGRPGLADELTGLAVGILLSR